jgi:membrane-associated phospholipid phosphatase
VKKIGLITAKKLALVTCLGKTKMIEQLFDLISLFFSSQWGFIAFIAVSVLAIYSFSKNRKVFLTALILAVLLGVGLKAFFGYSRPCDLLGDSKIDCPASEGFPSNHAVIATVLAFGALGTWLFWPYLFFALIIPLSRLWLGVHSLDQVAGGMALGAMVFIAVFEVNEKLFGSFYGKMDLDSLLEDNLLSKRVE